LLAATAQNMKKIALLLARLLAALYAVTALTVWGCTRLLAIHRDSWQIHFGAPRI